MTAVETSMRIARNYSCSLVASAALGVVFLSMMPGCGSQPTPQGDLPTRSETPPAGNPQPEKGGLSPLTQPWDADDKIPWQAAEILARLSKAAYLDDEKAQSAFQTIGFEKAAPIVAGSMTSYIVTQGPTVVIVFRGTDDLEDWLANLKVNSHDVAGGGMHAGFHDAYRTLRSGLHTALGKVNPKNLWITGHSLGGALAVICAHDLSQANISVQGLVTFGQPKMAHTDLAAYLDEHLTKKHVRFVNGDDIVARVPPMFTHSGSLVWFHEDGVAHSHAKVEVVKNKPALKQLGIAPMSEKEFWDLQRQLRRLRRGKPPKADPPPGPAKLAMPFLEDHGIDRYLDRIKQRGAANPPGKPAPPDSPVRPGRPPSKPPSGPAPPRFP